MHMVIEKLFAGYTVGALRRKKGLRVEEFDGRSSGCGHGADDFVNPRICPKPQRIEISRPNKMPSCSAEFTQGPITPGHAELQFRILIIDLSRLSVEFQRLGMRSGVFQSR